MSRVPVIPKPTLERLFSYYRLLLGMNETRRDVVSSEELGRRAGVDAAQVRKDLTFCGECGRPGIGYLTRDLIEALENGLGLKRSTSAALVGIGRLGAAIHDYSGFARFGLRIAAVFDVDPELVGRKIGEHEVYAMDRLQELLGERGIRLAIIAVPAAAAQVTADALVRAGAKAIWNFAPVTLRVPPGVIVRNEDLSVGLATLAWYLSRSEQ